ILPLFCLMAVYFHAQWQGGRRLLKPLLWTGLAVGFFLVGTLHETQLVQKFFHRTLPAQMDPLRRVRGWRATALVAERARHQLIREGKPAFIIGEHYGLTGLMSFYLTEAHQDISENPLVFYRWFPTPKNQFFFWRSYQSRVGQNAIYVQQVDLPKLPSDWIPRWLKGEKIVVPNDPKPLPPPRDVVRQFATVTDLGVSEIFYDGRVFRRVQLFACRDLQPPSQWNTAP
ncbi:MAG: hypothetical protein ABJC04_08770, partial [Verrucomicrobiota bacterium]